MKETFTLSGNCDWCHEYTEHLRTIALGEYRCQECYEDYFKRLIKNDWDLSHE